MPLDADAPTLECGAEIAIECGSGASFTADYEAMDACGEPSVEVHEPTALELGLNPIVVVATDGNGNTSSCVQPVRVTDSQAPTMSCAGALEVLLSEDAARCEASATVTAPTVSDTCDADVVVVSDAPSRYPMGETEVTFTALDKAGNTATCAVTVTAVDATAPRVSCGSPQATLESDITPRATDVCGAVLEVELSACVAVRDGVEVELGEECPV
ncbi:MAG TPA: HYR domain-containing protein, partial [Myxococcota bacterium]|nr:HYR domain-containing protein [Myxococcota bacterium]